MDDETPILSIELGHLQSCRRSEELESSSLLPRAPPSEASPQTSQSYTPRHMSFYGQSEKPPPTSILEIEKPQESSPTNLKAADKILTRTKLLFGGKEDVEKRHTIEPAPKKPEPNQHHLKSEVVREKP
ncbi:hypothetical protein HID58_083021 [Brassica napus]|uniref:Uncharacterized protein n=1 Tax=Brassica napus TaxID=3708 RepID=A0ABQ7YCA2_BRANA|nr:hypothetical protein HID58_083021 [Brassica napus]